MSITRDALRLCVVRCLRGKTFAGPRVKDSQIVPIEECDPNAPSPYLAVYTDDSRPGTDGRHTSLTIGQQSVLIDIAVTARMERIQATGPDGQPLIDPESGEPLMQAMWLDHVTDAGMELVLGAIERQVRVALNHPTCQWADMARSFGQIMHIASVRGPSQRDGLRFVGRQLQITVEMSHDPAAGTDPLSHITWSRFLSALRSSGEPDLVPIAQSFEKLIRCDGVQWSTDEARRAAVGMTLAEARATLMGEPA
jgi:hypothetical protein